MKDEIREVNFGRVPNDLKALVKKLYLADYWEGRGLSKEEQTKLWEEIRDAIGLAPGTATQAGVGGPLVYVARTMELIVLKPCPFCGEKVDLKAKTLQIGEEGDSYDDLGLINVVECQNCGAIGSEATTPEKARKEWNMRKS